jgi:hypothetical protein
VETLGRALAKIRHLNFDAAVVRGFVELDPLEFVLNAREIDADIPVIVLAQELDRNLVKALESRRKVWVVENIDQGLQSCLRRILDRASK